MNLFYIHSLTFLKSYNKGYSMDPVRHSLMSGVDLTETFTEAQKIRSSSLYDPVQVLFQSDFDL